MCTYYTEQVPVSGSAKAADRWFRVSEATVYFDHPVHALADHSLNIDFPTPAGGRLALELTEESARALVAAIVRALAVAP
jgi:hypothetical protein